MGRPRGPLYGLSLGQRHRHLANQLVEGDGAVLVRIDSATFPLLSARAEVAGRAIVGCWCERRWCSVPASWVREGKTGSCGRRDCRP